MRGKDQLSSLPRRWSFTGLDDLRPTSSWATYQWFDLDEQPTLQPDENLSWLDAADEQNRWAIESPERREHPFTVDRLRAMVPDDVLVPASLTRFAMHADLRRRIRSATGCYLDLGDFAARTSSDGVLLHVLSDQQWCRHWLVYLDGAGRNPVLTTTAPIGFDLTDDIEDWGVPDVVPLDGTFELEVCADFFSEFLLRFWIENELFYGGGSKPDSLLLASYAAALRSRSH